MKNNMEIIYTTSIITDDNTSHLYLCGDHAGYTLHPTFSYFYIVSIWGKAFKSWQFLEYILFLLPWDSISSIKGHYQKLA